MATWSDCMYSPSEHLVHIKGDPKRYCQIPTKAPTLTQRCPAPQPVDKVTGGDRYQTSFYPFRLQPRMSSAWAGIMGSADGTGYLATNYLPPQQPKARLGDGYISREVLPENDEVSRLLIDGTPAVHYWSGAPFYMRTDATPFLYLIPQGVMAQVNGYKFRIDVMSHADRLSHCTSCFG